MGTKGSHFVTKVVILSQPYPYLQRKAFWPTLHIVLEGPQICPLFWSEPSSGNFQEFYLMICFAENSNPTLISKKLLVQKASTKKRTSNSDSRKSLIKGDIWIMVSHFITLGSHFLTNEVILSQPHPNLQSINLFFKSCFILYIN